MREEAAETDLTVEVGASAGDRGGQPGQNRGLLPHFVRPPGRDQAVLRTAGSVLGHEREV